MASDATVHAQAAPTMAGGIAGALSEALAGRRGRLVTGWLFTGPAVVASIAYVDPGNFATNIQAGAKYGYTLLWVVVVANLVAMLFQALSAKLGIVTGQNLAELSRDRFPQPVPVLMWAASEVAAMATDLAEFLGGAIGLSLLTGASLLTGMVATAIVTYAILVLGGTSFRRIELGIGAFVAVIGICYLIEVFIAPVNWGAAVHGMVTPQIPDGGALILVAGHRRRHCHAARDLPAFLAYTVAHPAAFRRAEGQGLTVFQPRGDRRAERGRRY